MSDILKLLDELQEQISIPALASLDTGYLHCNLESDGKFIKRAQNTIRNIIELNNKSQKDSKQTSAKSCGSLSKDHVADYDIEKEEDNKQNEAFIEIVEHYDEDDNLIDSKIYKT